MITTKTKSAKKLMKIRNPWGNRCERCGTKSIWNYEHNEGIGNGLCFKERWGIEMNSKHMCCACLKCGHEWISIKKYEGFYEKDVFGNKTWVSNKEYLKELKKYYGKKAAI